LRVCQLAQAITHQGVVQHRDDHQRKNSRNQQAEYQRDGKATEDRVIKNEQGAEYGGQPGRPAR